MRARHSFVRPLLATILVLTLLLTMNPALVYGTQINSYDYQAQGLDRPDLISYEQAKKKGHIRRVPAMENESTFVFRNINGTLTSYTYGVKVQERDKSGKLKAIDLDFQTKKDLQDKVTGYTLSNDAFQVGLPSELGNGQGLSVKTDRLALTMTPIRPDGADQTLALGQLKKVQDYNGKLSYPGALGKDSAIEYSSTLTGLKEEIILSKAPADPVLRFRITAEGAAARVTETGAVEFYDPKTLASLGRIPEPYAMDSFKGKRVEGDGHYTEAIKVSLVEAAPGEWVYGLAVDEAFLYNPKTVYPVVIDPSVTISGSVDIFDTYASSGTPTIYYYNTDKMYVGKDSSLLVCRGYTKFNLASLTSADALMVTDAQYVNQEYLGYTTTCYIRLYQVTSAWTSGTLNWNNQPSIGSTIIDSKLVNGAGIYSFNVTTLVENWFLNARGLGGYAANGFTLRSDREGSIVLRKFRSSEATTNPPYLAITYTAVDRTAPNAPTGLTPTYFKHPDYNGSVQLSASWNAATDLPELNGSGIKNYEIDIKRADGTVLLSDTTTATSYTTTAYFDDNTTYTFDVRAVDNATDVYGAGIYNESGNATATLDVPDCEKPTIAYAAFDPDNWTAADTGISDTASGRKTVAKKSDDADSFDQSIVVTDSTTLAQLYAIGVVNTENAITLTTNIASTEQAYVYAKDTHGRLYQTSYTLPDTTSIQKADAFGDLGQMIGSTLSINGVNRLQNSFSYKQINGVIFSNQVETETIQAGGSSTSYGYSYDKLGNITKITKTDGGVTSDLYRYVYDEASHIKYVVNIICWVL